MVYFGEFFQVGVRVFLVRENGHCPYVSPGAAHDSGF